MSSFNEVMNVVCKFMLTTKQANGGGAQDDTATEFFAVSAICKLDYKHALQAAGWRARAYARRNSWRMFTRNAAREARDLENMLQWFDARTDVYGPWRVMRLHRVHQATMTAVNILLSTRSRLRPVWDRLLRAQMEHVRSQELADEAHAEDSDEGENSGDEP